ncbi:MAG: bifunctional DNA-formamidopyrimidine glycosylase/DNA-(apurinic or apyrimidinic site) lyase [Planctomycetota bacterium]
MPELPEVEITRRGIEPHLLERHLEGAEVREPRLRWRVPPRLGRTLTDRVVRRVGRRGKFLLIETDRGTILLHLGMSGSLRVLPASTPPGRHDHVDLTLEGGECLRLRDPRRFGAVLWTRGAPESHPLLSGLGPEPLGAGFSGDHLHDRSRGRKRSLHAFLLDGRVLAGIGNIYASEAAFAAGIHPARAAGRISLARYRRLGEAIRSVLEGAIARGGTTLRDFRSAEGNPGFFQLSLRVYGREGETCRRCGGTIRRRTLSGRSIYFCPRCQR